MKPTDKLIAFMTELKAIGASIRNKTGKTEEVGFYQLRAEIDGIQAGGGSSGIGAVKFVDVDITVDASTATAVAYTVDNLELVSSVENPTKWNAFSKDDAYIAFITPKEITGVATGNTVSVYNRSMHVLYGNSNYTPGINVVSYGTSGVGAANYGVYAPTLICDAIEDGKPVGHLTVNVRNHSNGDYEVVAGTYNVQVWHLNDFDWGHTS